MSTATTASIPPDFLESYARTVTNFVRRVDRWNAALANGTGATVRPPSKNSKNRAYEVAFHINQHLGRDRVSTVEGLRETVAAYRAAYGNRPSPTSKAAGAAWAARARQAGFQVGTRNYGSDAVVILRRYFAADDTAAYSATEAEALSLLAEATGVTYGSTWGTTSDGVGGHAGLTGGYVELLRSGISKRFASGIAVR